MSRTTRSNTRRKGYWHGFQFRYGEMTGIDRKKQLVYLAATYDEEGRQITPVRSFRYDTLVIAIGCVGNDFGTPGVNEYAIMLDTPEQAERFNRRLINACVRAYAQPDPIRPGQLHVAIIGAGATGTELAAELHQTTRGVVAFGLDKIDPEKDIEISLIEAAPRILPALPERISEAVTKALRELKVEILTGSPVTAVTAEGVKLSDGSFIPSELVVWAAGVKGPEVLAKLDGLEVSRSNQLVVTDTLQTTRDPNIFAIRRLRIPGAQQGRPRLFPRARRRRTRRPRTSTRRSSARCAASRLRPFKYRDFGSLVSLGEYSTVGSLMGFIGGRSLFVEGLFARLMYRSLYKMHEMALHGPGKVILDTLSRMLTRRTEPVVKLH